MGNSNGSGYSETVDSDRVLSLNKTLEQNRLEEEKEIARQHEIDSMVLIQPQAGDTLSNIALRHNMSMMQVFFF